MKTVYALRLADGYWYVGKTSDARFEIRGEWSQSEWIRRHPVRLVDVRESVADADADDRETRLTAELMMRYGVNRVRGARWCHAAAFQEHDEDSLASAISSALGRPYENVRRQIAPQLACARCGAPGHGSENCEERYHEDGGSLTASEECSFESHGDECEGFIGHWSDDGEDD